MGKRQEAALETKRKIVSAVNELLKEKSLNEISIEDITTKAGVEKYSFDRDNILELLNGAVERKELAKMTPTETLTEIIMNAYYGAVAV